VYGAVDATGGESVFVEWSHLDGECFEHFLQESGKQGGEDEVHKSTGHGEPASRFVGFSSQ
jgi:hypothetical protein